ncbi:NAD-binding protein [Halomarina oriensis]|uniref:Potassium channel protein n=1 Tax=Halomarina oriensis TaxID=671145 RepID=A0A6B0GR03_9EURY|nr:NAD-binding protein [Halomarina oriensis]MWG35093.1 potassium channel protein [Halomarina oriensis]
MVDEQPQTTRLLRVRFAVLLVFVTALISFVTGLAAIGFESLDLQLRLSDSVPQAVTDTVSFTAVLTGFLLLVTVYLLRHRYEAGWYAALLLLPLSALQGVLLVSAYSLPLVVLSLAALPGLYFNRSAFDREEWLTTSQQAALGALVGSLAYGTAGSWFLREEFSQGSITAPIDALYFAVVTASTVGYGDVTPVPGSIVARLFTLSYLVVGIASFTVALGTLLGPALEARFARALGTMTDSTLELLDDHVIVVGFSDLTEPIVSELDRNDVPFVVITRHPERATALRERGVDVYTGDPSSEEPLHAVGIERAQALITATEDDAQDALAVLTARELNPDIRIVAAASDASNQRKLKRAGADTVISPAVLGGHLLALSASGGTDAEQIAARVLRE